MIHTMFTMADIVVVMASMERSLSRKKYLKTTYGFYWESGLTMSVTQMNYSRNFSETNLLTRNKFRESVFARDNHKCVICGSEGQDAHHIMERRLFSNGGYYLDNGATLCGSCHLDAESTKLSTDEIRAAASIKKIILPEHLYDDQPYDKWGNPILSNGMRVRGELFFDDSVQKIIKDYLHLFTKYIKYPRTYHLPWSPGINDNDRVIEDTSCFEGQEVVVTEKMDGENTTVYNDYIHARSVESKNHQSRDYVKAICANFQHELGDYRVCGENLYAAHSIQYDSLKSYFYGFSIWDDKNYCLPWDETVSFFDMLGVAMPTVLYIGPFNESKIREFDDIWKGNRKEGYVVRRRAGFHYSQFKNCVAKFVRPDHIKTVKHWMYGQKIVRNLLYDGNT